MGWNQKLPLLGKVTDEQVSEVISEVEGQNPFKEYQKWMGGRQSWGWSSFVDVKLEQGQIDFHWAQGFKPRGYPEAFREAALQLGLPVGELEEAAW